MGRRVLTCGRKSKRKGSNIRVSQRTTPSGISWRWSQKSGLRYTIGSIFLQMIDMNLGILTWWEKRGNFTFFESPPTLIIPFYHYQLVGLRFRALFNFPCCYSVIPVSLAITMFQFQHLLTFLVSSISKSEPFYNSYRPASEILNF